MQVRFLSCDIRAGFENTVEFSLKRNFDSVNLKATHGIVSREGNIIRFIPTTFGKETLIAKFYYKHEFVHLDSVTFDVIRPEVFPSIGSDLLKDRKVSLSKFKAIGGIIFYIRVNDYHWEPIRIESYRFSIIRQGNCIFSKIEFSNRYSDELVAKLNLLNVGDIILISDIVITSQLSEIANILPGVFEIE